MLKGGNEKWQWFDLQKLWYYYRGTRKREVAFLRYIELTAPLDAGAKKNLLYTCVRGLLLTKLMTAFLVKSLTCCKGWGVICTWKFIVYNEDCTTCEIKPS